MGFRAHSIAIISVALSLGFILSNRFPLEIGARHLGNWDFAFAACMDLLQGMEMGVSWRVAQAQWQPRGAAARKLFGQVIWVEP